MKLTTVVIGLLFILNNAFAQSNSNKKIDSSDYNYARDQLSNPKYYKEQAVIYVIDGKVIKAASSNNFIKALNPIEILKLSVLNDSLQVAKIYGIKDAKSAIIVIKKNML